MIDEAPKLTSQPDFKRLTDAQLAPFKGRQTAQIVDALGGGGAIDYRIKPLFADQSIACGTALTCDAGAADNYGVLEALEVAQPGDVLIAATGSYMGCAVVGDLVMGISKNCGVLAFITDGCVRDSRGIREFGLPCFAAGISPNSPDKNGPASVGLPVVVGGLTINSGDLILTDEDGVVVIAQSQVEKTAERLAKVLEAEADLLAQVQGGRKSMLNPS